MSDRRTRREPPERPEGLCIRPRSARSVCTQLNDIYLGLPQNYRDHRPDPPGSLYGFSRQALDRYMQEQGMDVNDQNLRGGGSPME